MMCCSNDKPSDVKFFGDVSHDEKQLAFMQFLATYGRAYASKEDVNHRFETFSANFDKIKAHNENNEHFKMAINQFSDLTEEEFTTHIQTGLSVPHDSQTKKHKKVSSE